MAFEMRTESRLSEQFSLEQLPTRSIGSSASVFAGPTYPPSPTVKQPLPSNVPPKKH